MSASTAAMIVPLRPARVDARRILGLLLAAALTASLVGGARLLAVEYAQRTGGDAAADQLAASDWSQIDSVMYAATARDDGGLRFTNHAHGLSATLDAGSVSIRSGAGVVSTSTVGIGRDGRPLRTAASDAPLAAGSSASWSHSVGAITFVEWWRNDRSGLEQGFDIPARLAGSGALRVTLELGGALQPVLAASDAVSFAGSSLRYEGLTVWDALGTTLPAHFELDGRSLAIVVDDARATYPVTIDPAFTQQAYLKSSRTAGGDQFGWSVAASGDTLVVGAYADDSGDAGVNGEQSNDDEPESGAAFVFVRDGDSWTQQAYLKASNPEADDWFGASVAISGDTIVVGATGEDSNATTVGGSQTDNTAASAGAAYVFVRSGTAWSQQAYLKASNAQTGDLFGGSVGIDGDAVIVGAAGEDSSGLGVDSLTQANNAAPQAGAAYIFRRAGTVWSQEAYVKASNTGPNDEFGTSVALDGDVAVVGAYLEDSQSQGVNGNQASETANASGAAYAFRRTGGVWAQQAYLKGITNDINGHFGLSAAVDGNTIVVGAPGRISGAGDVYVYFWTGTAWIVQASLQPATSSAGDSFGVSVSVSGDLAVVGAEREDGNATGVGGDSANDLATDAGAAWVFARTGSTWSAPIYLKPHNTDAHDNFGSAVAISGETIVAGAAQEASNTARIGGDASDNSASGAGAAYVFRNPLDDWLQDAYLKTSSAGADNFGFAVDVGGDTLVVGAPHEDSSATTPGGAEWNDDASSSGAAYVFRRNGAAWVFEAYLKGSGTAAGSHFGHSVAADGSTVVVGAPGQASDAGAAYVFTRGAGGDWTQQAMLTPSNADSGDVFGWSVDVRGDVAVVGAPGEDGNGTTAAADPANNGATSAGAAYVFTRAGTAWSQTAYLKASQTSASDSFGFSVATSGSTVIVGAINEDSASPGVGGAGANELLLNSGAAYVYVNGSGTWAFEASFKASNPGGGDLFGKAVSVSGDVAVAGAPFEDSDDTGVNVGNGGDELAENAGAAYVFSRSASIWSFNSYVKASNTDAVDRFGTAVAASGDLVLVGALGESSSATGINGNQADDSAPSAGAAYLFQRNGSALNQVAYLKASNTDALDGFGAAVAVDGRVVVGGSLGEDSDATGVNGLQDNDAAPDTGAAYAFFMLDDCASAPFSDVATGHPFCPEIEWMKDEGISTGFDDGTYRPTATVTRQAMSAFMARLAGVATSLPACTSAPFSDVPVGHPFCREIKWMKDSGISTGFDDGTYRPGIAVTRQAMSAFMARLAGATALSACSAAPFTDVPTSHPFCEEIRWMKENGISTGFNDGTYLPASNVTRQAMSAFMFRVSGQVAPAP